jgi:hypothetical protein
MPPENENGTENESESEEESENENECENEEQGFTITCPNCEEPFDPWEAHHSITGPDVAWYTCPNCSNPFRSVPPYPK